MPLAGSKSTLSPTNSHSSPHRNGRWGLGAWDNPSAEITSPTGAHDKQRASKGSRARPVAALPGRRSLPALPELAHDVAVAEVVGTQLQDGLGACVGPE